MSEIPLREAAKRCADEINTHVAGGSAGQWAAIRLSDGGSNHTPYVRRSECVRAHTNAPTAHAYIKIPHDGMPYEEAIRFLGFVRKAHAAGFKLTDPDDPRELMHPMNREDYRNQMNGTAPMRTGIIHD